MLIIQSLSQLFNFLCKLSICSESTLAYNSESSLRHRTTAQNLPVRFPRAVLIFARAGGTLSLLALSEFTPQCVPVPENPLLSRFTTASGQKTFRLPSSLWFENAFSRKRIPAPPWNRVTPPDQTCCTTDDGVDPEVRVSAPQAHSLWDVIVFSQREQVHYCALSKKVYTSSALK